jgi:CheY-like chemotaxis protein
MAGKSPNGLRVAIAEDNPDFRRTLATLLKLLGHEIACEASDGADLLQFCQQHSVDVVISDLDMPVVDGLEAAEALSLRRIPVILLTGHPDGERVNLAHEPVAVRLTKPVSADALEHALRNAVAAHSP